MTYKDLIKEIKSGEYKRVYLFHGEEEYVKESTLDMLKKAVVPELAELNYTVFDTASPDDIIQACDMMPFMTEHRLILCRYTDSKKMPKDKAADIIIAYLKEIPETTVLVFYVKGKADGTLKLTKALKSSGGEVLFNRLSEQELSKWVMQSAAKGGCVIDLVDASYMVSVVGTELLDLKNEVGKVVDYVGEGGKITKDIINHVVIKSMEQQIFGIYGYLTAGKLKDALKLMDAVMTNREDESLAVAGYLMSCMKGTLMAYDGMKRGMSKQQLEEYTGKKGYALENLKRDASKFSREQLLCGIDAFANVARVKLSGGSGYAALMDAITNTFGVKKKN